MEPDQIDLVARSFAIVEPNAPMATALFCRRLAQVAPDVRELFADDPREQADQVVSTVGAIVRELDHPDRLAPLAVELARRQGARGVRPEDVAAVGDAMLWTLATGLGHRFTSDHRAAWHAAYDAFAATMQRAVAPTGS